MVCIRCGEVVDEIYSLPTVHTQAPGDEAQLPSEDQQTGRSSQKLRYDLIAVNFPNNCFMMETASSSHQCFGHLRFSSGEYPGSR